MIILSTMHQSKTKVIKITEHMVGLREHGKESSGSIKSGEFLDHLNILLSGLCSMESAKIVITIIIKMLVTLYASSKNGFFFKSLFM
jgi:3-deoxy-D-manno-octulosonic acid (KDO) 8-phosphate synthase